MWAWHLPLNGGFADLIQVWELAEPRSCGVIHGYFQMQQVARRMDISA